jgi:hypothetical protein
MPYARPPKLSGGVISGNTSLAPPPPSPPTNVPLDHAQPRPDLPALPALPAFFPASTTDWQFDRQEYAKLNHKYGPFTVDACADEFGHNAQATRFYSPKDSFLSTTPSSFTDYDVIWCNPPFDDPEPFIQHYLDLKARAPHLSMVLCLPQWKGKPWRTLLQHFKLIRTFPTGSSLFTRPIQPGLPDREAVGPTRWPLQIWYDSPRALPLSRAAEQDRKPEPTTEQKPESTPEQPPAPATTGTDLAQIANVTDHRMAEQLIVFEATLPTDTDHRMTPVLLDSGATRNFIDNGFAQRLRIPINKTDKLRVRQANGTITATDSTVDLTLTVGEFTFTSTFVLTPLGHSDCPFPIILGKPWLTQFNPAIDWTTNEVRVDDYILRGSVQDRTPRIIHLKASKMMKVLRKQDITAFIATLSPSPPATTVDQQASLQLQAAAHYHCRPPCARLQWMELLELVDSNPLCACL